MHEIQQKILKILDDKPIEGLTLREIGLLVGEKLPQKIKHHLNQLEKKGLIAIDHKNKSIKKIRKSDPGDIFISLPILGSANCGPAEIFADQNINGLLKVSKSILKNNGDIFVIKAEGNSMNKAEVGKNKMSIENGDYVIVDRASVSPQNNDYVLSIIDNMANIKKYISDKKNNQIILVSESTQDYPPIYIHEDDNFSINGKVIQVIKKPNI